jgi:hypothetical protein
MNGDLDGRISGPPWIRLGMRSVRYLKEDLDNWLNSLPKFSPNEVNE